MFRSDKFAELIKNISQNLIAPPGTAIQIIHQNLTYIFNSTGGSSFLVYLPHCKGR